MKILYANLRDKKSIIGHKSFDCRIIGMLNEFADVEVLVPEKDWYDVEACKGKQIYFQPKTIVDSGSNNKYIKKALNKLSLKERMICYKNFTFINKLDKQKKYDYIIVSTFEVTGLFWGLAKCRNKEKFFLIEHMVSIYNKKLNRLFFNFYKNKTMHIVMEQNEIDYFKETLNVIAKRLTYIPHPLTKRDLIISSSNYREYDIVGISNSNSEYEIKNIISYEKKEGYFKKKNVSILLRSKTENYDDGWLKVICGNVNLPYDEYLSYINMAKVILLPFDISFGIRTSGTIIDAFSNAKKILGTRFATLQFYEGKYPHVCMTYCDIEDMVKKAMIELSNDDVSDYLIEVSQFKEERSDSNIISKFKKLFSEQIQE